MAGLMIMPACRSSRSPELLHEHNNHSSLLYLSEESFPFQQIATVFRHFHSSYVPEEPFPFQLALFFGFCVYLCCFVYETKSHLDEQEMFRKQMEDYVKRKKQYDLRFFRSVYANGIPKYRFYSYPPLLPYRTFENSDRIFYYLYKRFLVAMMSICSYAMANLF
jgi:hypothetical protein